MNPVLHTFNNPDFNNSASYQVTLMAENFDGCSDQIIKTVEVYPDIQASFSMDIDEGCHPLAVQFTNTSNGGYTYLWDFGDGSFSNASSPGHTYTNFTDSIITREVRLVATSLYNCQNEITGEVVIHPKPRAAFETDEVINCPPFDVQMSNISINATQFRWSFGDGTILDTTSTDPIHHNYNNSTGSIATYVIKLNASTSYGCADSTQQYISVYPGTIADFSYNDEGCTPMTGYFVNTSIRGYSYMWDFGDGLSTSLQDPSHVFYNFSDSDTSYLITLTSTSQYGCTDTTSGTINVYTQPEAEFTALPSHQVYPSATVNFDNLTNAGSWSYSWDLDDGTTSTLEEPAPHTYSTWGEYNISLSVASAHCYDSVSHVIRIFPGPPIAGFDTVEAGCEPLTVQFRNTSLYGDSYLWEFDDGTSSSTEFEPVHTFTEAGIYNVKLTVTGEGGRDYAYRQVEVYANPLVDFTVSPETVMLPDQAVQLYNLTEEGTTFLWDFGDGSTSTELNPQYLYSAVGVYTISLTAWTEHGCTARLIKPDAVTVLGKGLIVFPNAFEPDMSGPNGGYYKLNQPELNTVFHPNWEGVEEYHLSIYDRWGTLLYVSNDVMKGWDGYYQSKLCQQGVYVWKCEGTFSNGRPFILVGDVTLLRHRR
jgi:PKD repeat protein